jgi:arylsulfatase A-like enzyme
MRPFGTGVRAGVSTMLAISALVAGDFTARPAAAPPPQHQRSSGSRPNVILIVTDDQRADTLEAMPNVRRLLGGHGITFRNAFVTTSLCCPSRAGILTGRSSRHTGVFGNLPPNGGAVSFDHRSTLATWLDDAGYTNGFVGKYLNDYQSIAHFVPPGWDEWAAVTTSALKYFDYVLNENGRFIPYGSDPSDYSTDVLGRIATRFLRSARPPFFLHFCPLAPHLPVGYLAGPSAPPSPGPPVASGPSFNEADVSDKPWGRLHSPLPARAIASRSRVREHTAQSLQAVDRAVANMVEVLEERGQLDNTVIVFTSDNGLLLGEHRLWLEKIWPYEESIRVPLVVRTPWTTSPTVDEHLVLNVDLAPTLAELAGVTPWPAPDGRSLAPLLRGQEVNWRTAFVQEFLGRDQRFRGGPPPFNAIRTERHLYVEYRNGWRELYDLRDDPYQLQNLADLPAFAAIRASLAAELRGLIR